LCGVNPFGERDFLGDKTRDGGLTISPGSNLRFRYRVVIHPGPIEQTDPAASLADFARQR
ncbi:MAG: transmembrane prediction, partial [Blastocatellia bacterium]